MQGEAREAAIVVEDVWKRFRKSSLPAGYTTIKSLLLGRAKKREGGIRYKEVLRGISFRIDPGQTWGILGPNGAGKSTLLRLLTGIYRPDRGSITVRGRVASLLELGAGFHPEFSGRENVMLNGIVLGMSKREIQARFEEIVAFAELEESIDEPVRTYSSGMFMRLGFAVAAHSDPDVLFLDEILAVGDASFAAKCQERIRAFHAAGKTMLMVTHDMGAIREFCSHAIRLGDGVVVDEGPPGQVVERYLAATQPGGTG
jgi:ABC-type polysaccharide/polyol phosphate transport system ATPase subunit